MAKVSALVSAYYAERFLSQRIFNLQGYQGDIQIVVVCQSGSPEEAIASQINVTVVRTPGIPPLGEAWNLAIENATGDYLTTANTDDRFMMDGLETMVRVLDEHPEIGLVFAQVCVDGGGDLYPWKRIDDGTGEIADIEDLLFGRCIVGPMPVWRKAVHDEVGYFDETYTVASDYDMWLKMARAGVRFWYIDEPTGVYAKRADSLEYRNKSLIAGEISSIRSVNA